MRLIDVDEFKAFLGEVRARYNLFSDEERPHYEAYSKALYILNEYLEDAPSINLVRCGECRCRNENCGMGEHKWCEKLNMSTTPNDFCSYGEREGE